MLKQGIGTAGERDWERIDTAGDREWERIDIAEARNRHWGRQGVGENRHC